MENQNKIIFGIGTVLLLVAVAFLFLTPNITADEIFIAGIAGVALGLVTAFLSRFVAAYAQKADGDYTEEEANITFAIGTIAFFLISAGIIFSRSQSMETFIKSCYITGLVILILAALGVFLPRLLTNAGNKGGEEANRVREDHKVAPATEIPKKDADGNLQKQSSMPIALMIIIGIVVILFIRHMSEQQPQQPGVNQAQQQNQQPSAPATQTNPGTVAPSAPAQAGDLNPNEEAGSEVQMPQQAK